jgi:hypothetical protein
LLAVIARKLLHLSSWRGVDNIRFLLKIFSRTPKYNKPSVFLGKSIFVLKLVSFEYSSFTCKKRTYKQGGYDVLIIVTDVKSNDAPLVSFFSG